MTTQVEKYMETILRQEPDMPTEANIFVPREAYGFMTLSTHVFDPATTTPPVTFNWVDPIGEMLATITQLEARIAELEDDIELLETADLELSVLHPSDLDADVAFRPNTQIPMLLRRHDSDIWVSALGRHGVGASEQDAVRDLWSILEEEYQHLQRYQRRLGPRQLWRLGRLSNVMEPSNAA